ncbi:MAG: hypothetical protein RMJ66_06670, partial [Bacteroidia bacterium]|nr:hypothetical protein [Bacteroidia bacterium]
MKCEKIQVCAWRAKYLISLAHPLSGEEWHALRATLGASRLEFFVLSNGAILYKLTLSDGRGTLTGSSNSPDLYAVVPRVEADNIIKELMGELLSVV